ncbi:MAG: IclR family transcriptional regulator [Veillonellales bacterium]
MKLNKSAARSVEILNLLAKSKKPLTQLEVSQMLDLPKSSTYELLYTLLDKGMLEFDNEDLKTFKLSLKLFELGMTVLEKADLTTMARPILEDLSSKMGETVFLAVENKGDIVYLDRVEESSSITTSAGLGIRRPMYCTGLGKALLATYPANRVEEIWNRADLKVYGKNTIREYNDLVADIQQTRRRGYAIDNREMEDEIFCVAAPVYGRTDNAVGAISIATVYFKINKNRIEMLGKEIMKSALDISKRLGFRRNTLYFEK